MRPITRVAIALAILMAGPSGMLAQARPLPGDMSFGPGIIVGRIIDVRSQPIDSVEVRVTSPNRRAFTSAVGTYRLVDLKQGKYEITVRKFGYMPQRVDIAVDDKGGTLNFTLQRSFQGLPTVVTTADRRGLSGVIADSGHRVITNALVTVISENRDTRSDSTGAFYVDLKPGRYMVRVTHSIFSSKLVSVTIPNDHGRHVEVFMSPVVDRNLAKVEVFRDLELKERLVMRSAAWSKIMTREDIEKLGSEDASHIATAGATARVEDTCAAVLDGGPKALPLWAIDPRDIEVMEVYTTRPKRQVGGLGANEAARSASRTSGGGKCGATVYVWLRR